MSTLSNLVSGVDTVCRQWLLYEQLPVNLLLIGTSRASLLYGCSDCEGCEFAFARDILREDPDFLKHVDQLSIETHVSKAWMTTREQ